MVTMSKKSAPLTIEAMSRMLAPGGAWFSCDETYLRERFVAYLDAARSVPDNAALREALTDDAMREILLVLPPPDGFAAYADAVRERILAAAPASPAGLDVERLARAMRRQGFGWTDLNVEEAATDIAREYATLASPEEASR